MTKFNFYGILRMSNMLYMVYTIIHKMESVVRSLQYNCY